MRRLLTTLALLAACSTFGLVGSAHADSTPVGPLPAGPVQTIAVKKGQLVALALPRPSRSSGLVVYLAQTRGDAGTQALKALRFRITVT
jgi:hypothetical protein